MHASTITDHLARLCTINGIIQHIFQLSSATIQMAFLGHQMVFLKYAPGTVRQESEIDNSTNL